MCAPSPRDDVFTLAPWFASPSRRQPAPPIGGTLPECVELVLGDRVYVAKAGLPPGLVTRLMRLGAFQNPEFYRAQTMRLSYVWQTENRRLRRGRPQLPRPAAWLSRGSGGIASGTGDRDFDQRSTVSRASVGSELPRRTASPIRRPRLAPWRSTTPEFSRQPRRSARPWSPPG